MTPSPFRTKGIGYRGHMEYVAKHVKGGVAAMNAAFEDDELRAYFAQPFVASGWYDVMPLAHAGDVCARLMGVPLDTFLRARARHQVDLDLAGVYGFLARFATKGLIARGVSDAAARYFDFLTIDSHQTHADRVETAMSGVPVSIVDWMGVLMVAYSDAVFDAVGKPGHAARYRRGKKRDTCHGVAVTDFVIEIRWPADAG